MENKLIRKIRKHIIHLGLAFVLCSAFLGMPVAVSAQDGGPVPAHHLWGHVYAEILDGDPATGVEVTAWIDGEQKGSITTDSSGQYGDDPLTSIPFYLNVTGYNGDIIEFRVDGIAAEEVRWGVLIEEEPLHWDWTEVEPSWYVVYDSAEVNGLDLVYTPAPADETPPAAIADLAVSGVTSDSATLTWTAPGDDDTTGTASSYDVRYLEGTTPITEPNWGSATEASGELAPQVAGSGETFTVTGLNSDTMYYFAVKTADEVPNESDISNSPSGTTEETDDIAPAAITNLAVSMVTSSSATLTWTAPGDDDAIGTASSYDVRYLEGTTPITESNWASATEASGEPTPLVTGSGQVFIVTGLDSETTYYFAIKTADEVPNESDISNSPSGTTEEIDETPPAAITTLAVSMVTSSSATLTWTAPGDDDATGTATSYDVRYLQGTTPITESNWGSASQAGGEPAPQVAGSGETFTVTGLGASTTYYFAIKTADEVPNESGISNSPSGTTEETDNTPPAAITNLAVSGVTSSSVTLTWMAPGDDGTTGTATSYDVRYLEYTAITESNWASATPASGEPAPKVAGSTETFAITGLDSGTEYYFAVKTADEVPNWSDLSNIRLGTTSSTGGGGGGGGGAIVSDNTAPAAITDLAVSGVTADSATLTWTAPGDDDTTGTASEYDVRYLEGTVITESNWDSASKATGVPAPQAAGSSETFTVTGLDADTNYHFAVKTVDEVPIWSEISNSPSATTSSVVTTEEEEEVVTEEEEEVVTEEEEEVVTEEEEEVVTEEEEEEETIEPTPAAFIITNISISPDTPALDETVTITIDVTNTGETEGTYTAVLRINGVVEATQSITLDGGESGQVVFTTTKDEAGDYTVDINGQSTSFSVAQPVRLVLILGVIGGVILLGLLVFLGRRMYYARM